MRIIITDCDHEKMFQEKEVFEKAGFAYEHLSCKEEDELIEQAKGGEIMLTQYGQFSRRVITALKPELKQIIRYGVGVDTVDLEAATELGVQVCNVPDYGMNEVADQSISLMLALMRKVCFMDKYTKSKEWNYTPAIPIHRIPGSTIGLVGIGRIGRTFAKRLLGFDCRIIAYDSAYKVGEVEDGIEIVDFDTLLKEADAISIHCPLTEETQNLFNLETLKKMKTSAYLVNTARGGIINEADLFTALKEKIIAGAALDVVEKEPMKVGAELFELDNYIATPHIAWYSEESSLELKRKVAEEAVRFAKGEPIHYPVNHLQNENG